MSYHVDYGSTPQKRRSEKRTCRKAAFIAMFFLVFLFLVNAYWPQGAALLRTSILPERVQTTAAALESLAQDLQENGDLSEALTVFWQLVGSHENADPA